MLSATKMVIFERGMTFYVALNMTENAGCLRHEPDTARCWLRANGSGRDLRAAAYRPAGI